MTSTIASPPFDVNNQSQGLNQNQTNEKLSYVPHSPYYEPVHLPQFMKMSEVFINKYTFIHNYNVKIVKICYIIRICMIVNIFSMY